MKTLQRLNPLITAVGVFAAMACSTATAAAVITPHFDRSSVHSSLEMCRATSSGESLADVIVPGPDVSCAGESAVGDLDVQFTWADGSVASGVWAGATSLHIGQATISQSGDTFLTPWTIRNDDGAGALVRVVLSARGAPDMGFDTDNGNNPGHGAGGFPLLLDPSSGWGGGTNDILDVYYDWYNDWAGTTDMFHRMRLEFGANSALAGGQSLAFLQDTDEVPEPASLALVGLALVGVYSARRLPTSKGKTPPA